MIISKCTNLKLELRLIRRVSVEMWIRNDENAIVINFETGRCQLKLIPRSGIVRALQILYVNLQYSPI